MTDRRLGRAALTGVTAVLVVLAGARPTAARAQAVHDSVTGSVLRVSTVRTMPAGSRARAMGVGLLVRRQGTRQRVDVLRAVDDSVGDDWASLDNAPDEIRLHNRASRSTAVLRFSDLRLMFDSLMRVRFDSMTAVGEDLGPGPRLLGHATRHVQVRRSVRMTSARDGRVQTVHIVTETDEWVAPSLPGEWGANSVLTLTSASLAGVMEQIFGTAVAPVTVRGGGTLPAGLALRTVTRSRTRTTGSSVLLPGTADAGEVVTVDSAEVTSIERRVLPDSVFDAPAGYKVINITAEIRKLVESLETLGASLQGLAGRKAPKPFKPSSGKPAWKP
ncbi:MAG: hypothetical protein IT355_12860 [Gemmatimonadaceae bacterium]|nr:hypothetical protein [Gemmatimonadaceae bacterium]